MEEEPRRDPASRTFRAHVLGNLLALVAFCGAFAGSMSLLGRAALELPWFAGLAVVPLGLVLGAMLVVVVYSLYRSFACSLQPTNWFARLDAAGLELNLRSLGDARPGAELPVVRLALDRVRSMRRVTETWSEARSDGLMRYKRRWIELELVGVDVASLDRAIEEEHARRPRDVGLLGVVARTKHHRDPVVVTDCGRVRVEWSGPLFRDLKRSVRVARAHVDRCGLQPGLAEHLQFRVEALRRAA